MSSCTTSPNYKSVGKSTQPPTHSAVLNIIHDNSDDNNLHTPNDVVTMRTLFTNAHMSPQLQSLDENTTTSSSLSSNNNDTFSLENCNYTQPPEELHCKIKNTKKKSKSKHDQLCMLITEDRIKSVPSEPVTASEHIYHLEYKKHVMIELNALCICVLFWSIVVLIIFYH
jgi:hypothetical protein